jgi:hypothetical protein
MSVEACKGLHLRHLRHLEDIAAVHGAVVVHEHNIALFHGDVHLAKIPMYHSEICLPHIFAVTGSSVLVV